MEKQNEGLGDALKTAPLATGLADARSSMTTDQAPPLTIAPAHTPGPWFITEGPTYGMSSRLKVESAPDAERIYGMVICERGISTQGYPVDLECRANARLIAAAPDMLKALGRIEDHFDMDGYGPDAWKKLAHEMADVARQAIRKATQP